MSAQPANSEEIRQAIMTVLGTLPEGSEFRFFWRDGKQHMSMKFVGEPEQTMCLNRRPDGVGVPTPVHH